MDKLKALWTLDFLLSQPIKDSILSHLISVLPLPEEDHQLLKKILLRRISSYIGKGKISDKILESLEMIEELNHRTGIGIMDSMKEAYCAVAVECTVKFLRGTENLHEYFQAILKIWRGKIMDMEKGEGVGLVSDRLKELRDELEAALWNEDVRKRFLRRDTRNDAIRCLRFYLGEAEAEIGPSFLDLVVEKAKEVGDTFGGELLENNGNVLEDNISRVDVVGDEVEERTVSVLCCDPIEETTGAELFGDQGEERGGGNLEKDDENVLEENGCRMDVDVSEDNPNLGTKVNIVGDQVEERLSPEFSGDRVVEKSGGELLGHQGEERLGGDFEKNDENVLEGNDCRMDVVIPEGNPSVATKRFVLVSSPEVRRVQEDLRSSVLDLHVSVKDPLPDALRIAETISVSMVREEVEHVRSGENHNDVGTNECSRSVRKGAEVNGRPGLMQRNKTACTFEWDDDESVESSNGRASSSGRSSSRRIHLPTPKITKASPLNKQEPRKTAGRRKKKRWSSLEEETLYNAVKEHGKGNWKRILDAHSDIFEDRNAVDLKDKWRNMTA